VTTPDQIVVATASDGDGTLWVLAKKDGAARAEHSLPAAPIYQGLAVSGGELVVSLADGSVIKYGGQGPGR
jgi:hypothetical protein